jgi:PPOX class probable F420-dependent enzyme
MTEQTSVAIPERLGVLLDGPTFAHLTTVDSDGWPQASAMWIMREGDRIVFNTAEGRRKWRNMKDDPRVAVSISDPNEPYANFSIQGRVVEMRTSDGVEVIDALARKYLGVDKYQWMRPGMVRVTVIVEPTRIASNA